MLKEYQQKIAYYENAQNKGESARDEPIKILHGKEQEKLNMNNNVEKYYVEEKDKEEETDHEQDIYIVNETTRNRQKQEQYKQPEGQNSVRPAHQHKNGYGMSREQKLMQTPDKRMNQTAQSNQSVRSSYRRPPHALPPHITDSMRKIRNSPALAENEARKGERETPGSVVQNPYEEDEGKSKTVYRLKNNSIDMQEVQKHHLDTNPIQSTIRESDRQDDEEEEEEKAEQPQKQVEDDFEEEFKPDPDLLNKLNENMFKNDRNELPPGDYQETEVQRKRREERERIEAEREKERQKLLEMLDDPNNNCIYWGGDDSDPDEEGGQTDRNEHENVSVNSLTGKYKLHHIYHYCFYVGIVII